MADPAKLFTDADRSRINDAVASAEARAAVDIVPVVARHSGRYDRAEDIVGLWVSVIAMAATWARLPERETTHGSWDGLDSGMHLAALIIAVVVGFIVGAAVAGRVDALRSLFTSSREMHDCVTASARQIFFDNRIHHTTAGDGVLIYVSLLEHIAVVLADRAIVDRVGQPALDEIRDELIRNLRASPPTDALAAAIDLAGHRVAAVLPRNGTPPNQLPNALVLVS
jgi:putative membrane protein